jgi:hypothetical protein
MTSGIDNTSRPGAPLFVELEDLLSSANSSPNLEPQIRRDSYPTQIGLGGLNGIN